MADPMLTQLPRRLQLLLVVTLLLAACGASYVYLEAPLQQRLAERRDELASLRRRIDKASTSARHLPEVRIDADNLRARLESLRAILPDEKDAANLLRQVHTLAVQSNLTIQAFRPQSANVRQLYAEWPINLVLEGTYHNLGEFLDRVGRLPRIINVSNLVIRGKQSTVGGATVDITCTATTFVLLDVGSGTASPAAASTPESTSRHAQVEVSAPGAATPVDTELLTAHTYRRDGRRDPFVSLMTRRAEGGTTRAIGVRPDGLAGVLVDEIIVRGLIKSRGAWIAIVAATNGRAYSMRSGDRLMDGSVVSITQDAVVFVQEIGDPLSRSEQGRREVRKYLRAEVQ